MIRKKIVDGPNLILKIYLRSDQFLDVHRNIVMDDARFLKSIGYHVKMQWDEEIAGYDIIMLAGHVRNPLDLRIDPYMAEGKKYYPIRNIDEPPPEKTWQKRVTES